MVLGVDDFRQEFVYHAARDEWLARDLIGAGTVRGLDVSTQPAPQGKLTELVVQPGVAITPHGRIVRVPTAQCAVLDDWIASNQTTVATHVHGSPPGSPPTPQHGTITLYTILRYKHCLTDQVPIPGEPCRSATDAMAPSRIADDFSLELSVKSPAATEEPGMVAVIGWLTQIPIVSGPGNTPSDVVAAMKAAFGATSSPPGGPLPLPPASPPASLRIGAASAPAIYCAALQFYTTTLRDLLQGSPTVDGTPKETGILLATVQVPVAQGPTGQWMLDPGSTVQVNTARSFLLPLDMLKEAWIASVTSLARHRLVAAGLVPVTSTTPLPPATSLQAWWGTGGEIHIRFPDTPGTGIQYIIKALPFVATSPAGTPPPITLVVTSISTSSPGCTIAAFVGGVAATAATAAGLSILLEVTAVASS
jgi:hypothetical protein